MVLISSVVLEGGLHVGSSDGRIESVANLVFIYLFFTHENRLLAKAFNENMLIDQGVPKSAVFEKVLNDLVAIFSRVHSKSCTSSIHARKSSRKNTQTVTALLPFKHSKT